MRVIYMIGHSNHRIGEFIALLQRHGVQLLVDVRTWPQSNRAPQFNRDNVDLALKQAGIGYRWVPALGGLRPSPRAIILKTLTGLLNDQRTICLMCSEGDFKGCHRHYLLAPVVQSLSYQVQHITPTGALIPDPGSTLGDQGKNLTLFSFRDDSQGAETLQFPKEVLKRE
jgi:uncharacterized protein (DUF488 family)